MRRREAAVLLTVLAGLCLSPGTAYADAVWQALFFEKPILVRTWWVIPAGLAIEYPVVSRMLKQGPRRAVVATVVMNLVSFFLGAMLQAPTLSMGGPACIVAIFAIASIGNTLIEGVVLNRFRPEVFNRRTVLPLLGVNAVSVGLTITVLLFVTPGY